MDSGVDLSVEARAAFWDSLRDNMDHRAAIKLRGRPLRCTCAFGQACTVDIVTQFVDELLDEEWTSLISHTPLAGKVIVHLFSGHGHRRDSIHHYVNALGGECWIYDLINGSDQDLADERVWREFL